MQYLTWIFVLAVVGFVPACACKWHACAVAFVHDSLSWKTLVFEWTNFEGTKSRVEVGCRGGVLVGILARAH